MVLRTYLECDRCGTRCEYDSFYIITDHRMDAAGSTEDVTESVDLCCCCCQTFIRGLLATYNHGNAQEFVRWARKKPEAIRM